MKLDRFQTEAIAAWEAQKSVLVAAPTGAGKTLIAEHAIEACIRSGREAIYTAPVKALSNQKYRDFRERFGEAVGIVTGDVSLNASAPVRIMTTEIFRNSLFEEPERLARLDTVVFDEIHYLDDEERGTVWEESLLFCPQGVRLICLSATVPNLDEIAAWIRTLRAEPVEAIVEKKRPVPLHHGFFVPERGLVEPKALFDIYDQEARRRRRPDHRKARTLGLPWLIETLRERRQLPCLFFCFQRAGCERKAASTRVGELLTKSEREQVLRLFDELAARYRAPAGRRLQHLRALAANGISFHHAGLLPVHKEIIERLYTTGLIKVLFTTETFALGINMPVASVVFDALEKFDGVDFGVLSTRDYYQMAGRAGRRGMDDEGFVYSRIPDFRIPKPEIQRLLSGRFEPIRSQFQMSYSTLLNLWGRHKERLFDACRRSLGHFQLAARGRTHAADGLVAAASARIEILKRAAYLDDRGLLPRGLFAARIHGFEIPVTELFFKGLFEDLDEPTLAALFMAIVYEPRRTEHHAPLDRARVEGIQNDARRILSRFRESEQESGVLPPIPWPDFRFSPTVFAWCEGTPFAELQHLSDLSEGDVVRNLRRAIQMLRQAEWALHEHPALASRLRGAIRLLNRDVVDAARELEN